MPYKLQVANPTVFGSLTCLGQSAIIPEGAGELPRLPPSSTNDFSHRCAGGETGPEADLA